MANIEKHLLPTASTTTEMRECPKDGTTISTISICSVEATDDADFSIRVVPTGDTRGDKHLIASENTIGAGNSKYITIGLTPKALTKIYVLATGDIAFSIYGKEGA